MSKLRDIDCRNAKRREKVFKLSDGGGLYLVVLPSGTRSWRLSYRYGGKLKQLVLGTYPLLSLALARVKRDEAKRTHADGLDPSVQRKKQRREEGLKVATTFEAVVSELIEKLKREGRAAATIKKKSWLLLKLTKSLAHRPISEIEPPELLDVLRPIEARGKLETARRLREAFGQVFTFAIATGKGVRNPATDLKGALAAPKVTHRAILRDAEEIGGLWRALREFSGQPDTRFALHIALLTAARPGEVRTAEWSDIAENGH